MAVSIEVLTKRVNLGELYPPFRTLYVQLLERCQSRRGVDYYAISGLRDYAEQRKLFAIGRIELADGSWMEDDDPNTKIVTKAPPGLSSHNYGIAADSCRDANLERVGLQPGWNIGDYMALAFEADALGLDAAYFWKKFTEGPHVQLDIARKGLAIIDLKKIFEASERRAPGTGLHDVWTKLDSVGPWLPT